MDSRKTIQKNLEFSTGVLSLALANGTALLIFNFIFDRIPEFNIINWIGYFLILFVSYIVIFFCFLSPINLTKRSRSMEFVSTLRNCTLTYALFSALLIMTKNELIESRYLFLSSFVLYCMFSLVVRYILKRILLEKISSTKFASMVGVIATYDRACNFIPQLQGDWSKQIKAVAILDSVYRNGVYKCKINNNSKKIYDINGIPIVANSENLLGWIRTASLDEIYINLPFNYMNNLSGLIEELEDMGIVVHVNIASMETIITDSKYDNFDCIVDSGYPMAIFSPTSHNSTALFLKRVTDIIGAVVGTIISLPIILVTAIPLLIESPGPLIFKQQRVGKNGRLFNIYKLRSMYVDAEERKKALMEQNKMDGHMFKVDNDPRITKVGRFIRKYSIDELPQFWNVLKGDMSLVGTRPPTIDEFEKYESHHKRRLSMKPGITGKWQVSGRSNIINFEDIVKMDCEYIDDWSIVLDAKILFKTVEVVIKGKGAE